MGTERKIEILRTDVRILEIVKMVHELDRYMGELYPAESNHLVDIDTLAQPNVFFLGAKLDGKYVGCGAIMVHGDEYAEVKRVFVDPAARGLGLGKKLINRLAEITRQQNIKLMRLETGISQPEALGLFETCGFKRCASFGDYPANDPYSVFMEREI